MPTVVARLVITTSVNRNITTTSRAWYHDPWDRVAASSSRPHRTVRPTANQMISGNAHRAAILRACSGSAYGESVQVARRGAAAWRGTGSADVPDICRMLSGFDLQPHG